MRTAALALLVMAAALGCAFADYSCPEDTCTGSCHCASTKIPGGLDSKDTPLFIVLTNDDGVNPTTQPVILNITDRHQNKNGCKMPATWFVSTNFSDPGMIQQVWLKGHEIATHTIHHVADPGADEIVGAKVWLNQTAKIPMEQLQGFRAPFLLFSPEQRDILSKNGFRYDSSITEQYGPHSPTSPTAQELVWPYTMDYGIAQDCSVSTGTCDANERHAGLWEFPMWDVQDANGITLAAMDPQGNNLDVYTTLFDERYAGNRAPLGIYIHAAWLIAQPDHLDELNQFIAYAMSHDNVFLATISQVLDWMENPVPASQLNLTCYNEAELLSKLPGGQLCILPEGGCLYGTFNSSSCVCDCQNERVNAGGYCKDSTGRCTVSKGYNFTTKEYTCPADSASSAPEAAPTSQGAGAVSLTSPQCGHDLVSYQGLAISGSGDNSELYAEALKAIDGSCDTCAQAPASTNDGAFFTVSLNGQTDLTGVSIRSNSTQLVDVLVGNDATNNGLNNPACAKGVNVTADQATVVPCATSGSEVTIVSSDSMTLCDVYPVARDGALPAAAQSSNRTVQSVMLELDINDVTVIDFQSQQAGDKPDALCKAIVQMTGDANATCMVVQVIANARRRHLLQSGVHVTAQVNTTNAETLLGAFGSGASVASSLLPAGFSVNPATVKAYPRTTDSSSAGSSTDSSSSSSSSASAPATSDSGSGSTAGSASGSSTSSDGSTSSDSSTGDSSSSGGSNVGAIVGAVVGGIAGLALIVGGVWFCRKRRATRAATDNAIQARTTSFNPAFESGVTATVATDSASAKAKMAAALEDPSPLGSAIASFKLEPQQ